VAAQPLEDEHFSRAGGAVAALFSTLPFTALAGATLLAPLVAGAALIAAPWPRLFRALRMGGVSVLLLLVFAGWAAASLMWSAKPDVTPLLVLAAAGWFLLLTLAAGLGRRADAAMARRAGTIAVAVLLALLAIEAAFEFPISRAFAPQDAARGAGLDAWLAMAQRGAALAALWVWGAAAMLVRFRWPGWIGAFAMFAVLVWVATQLPDRLVLVALGAGLVAALPALRWPRGAVASTALFVAFLSLAAPLYLPSLAVWAGQTFRDYTQTEPPFPWLARLDVWAFATDRIHERLLTGWGLGAGQAFPETHSLAGFTTPYMPGDPQSLPLHLWLETGAIGAMLAGAALAEFGLRAGAALSAERWPAAAASGAMATAFVIAVTSVDAWALWWWAGLAIAAAMVRAARGAP
jgi:hypothetical protein